MRQYVFGYGSLVNQEALNRYLGQTCLQKDTVYCYLKNYRRCWNVAMHNRTNLPAYKYYVDTNTAIRPDIYVTFLNIRKLKDAAVAGVLFPVGLQELDLLDQRERNYHRVEVTTLLDIQVDGRVWTYIGTHEAKARYQLGIQNRNAVIAEEYFHFVKSCFDQCIPPIDSNFREATDHPEVPLRKLVRVDIDG